MTDKVASAALAAVALVTAAVVEGTGGDPAPYTQVATLAVGYFVGHTVQKSRSKKR